MNLDLRHLYQEVILDHNRAPRNQKRLEKANHEADGFNPLCGDKIHLYLTVEGNAVKEVSFEGSGCAISTASASMMTEAIKGKALAEVKRIFSSFHQLVTGSDHDLAGAEHLGKLAVFAGVREFPTRVKCATLAWHTLNAALENKQIPVSTE